MLTLLQQTAILNPSLTPSVKPLMQSMGRFEPRKYQGAGVAPLTGNTLFLCPKSVLTSVKRALLWWGGLLEQFLCTAVQTSFLLHRPKFEPFSGGLQSNIGVSPMTSNTQKPSIQDTKPSIHFTQNGSTKRMSTSGLTLSAALEVWQSFNPQVSGGAK